MKIIKLALAFTMMTSISASAFECTTGLTPNKKMKWCEVKLDVSKPMDFKTMMKSKKGKADMRNVCDEYANKYKIDQMLWLTPDGMHCAVCAQGYKYDPEQKKCKKEHKK